MEVDFKTFVEGYIQIALPKAEEKFTTKLNSMVCNMTQSVAISAASMIFSTDLRAILQHVITPCRIISTCSNTIATAFTQKYMFTHMNNASVKLAKVNTKGHFPHLTKANMVAEQISNVIQEWRTENQPSPSTNCFVPYHSLWEQNMLLRRQVKAIENELQESRIQKEILSHEMNRREETHTQDITLLIEPLQNQQPELPEIRASSQDHSASTILNESMQHYQPESFYERTLALPPQMTEGINHHQPVFLEQSISAAPLQDHSASMQHYQPELFYERTLALPPQMTEAMNHHQPMVLEQSTSAAPLQDHSASRILNEAMQHYQIEIFDERTLALPPQMTEAMNCHQPLVLEQSTLAAPSQISGLGLHDSEYDILSTIFYNSNENHIM
ncbi:hypothetical protein ACQ4PT_022205 [Festuca glaucescens]